jgi:hypothetical protein
MPACRSAPATLCEGNVALLRFREDAWACLRSVATLQGRYRVRGQVDVQFAVGLRLAGRNRPECHLA